MKISMRFIILSMFVLCTALSAFAQSSTTGSISGRVVDSAGASVPGVVVTVTSPNLIRAQTATTNDSGSYSISNLPPGRYAVNVAAAGGFGAFAKENIEVNLSSTTTVDVDLQAAGATAVVNITDTAGAAVDTNANTTGTNISTEQFSNFPTQRTVQSLYTIAPTVTRSGLRDSSGRDRDPSVGGSSGPENNYILDGVTVSDPAFGGSGANLPFEFVQEIEIKTGAYGAEYGKSTGGIFNVVTKSGSNEVRGDAFLFFTPTSFVRSVKPTAIPFTGSAPDGFSEVDAGFDIGGPIVKDKLWFFGAFNPQRRKNYFLTQTFLNQVENQVTTPFYAGKITWGISQNHTMTFSTFGDFTKQEGFLFGNTGFGANPESFRGTTETGGSNYAARLNSTFSPSFIGEFAVGIHLQRANTIPSSAVADAPIVLDNFAIRNGATVLTPFNTTSPVATVAVGAFGALQLAYVDGRGGALERNYTRGGFGLVSDQDRNRYEMSARLQNTWGRNTFKYGVELATNRYTIFTRPTGPALTLADPNGQETGADHPANTLPFGYRVTNNFGVCTTAGTNITCPAAALTTRVTNIINSGQGPAGILTATTNTGLTAAQLATNPFLVLSSVRVRDFVLDTGGEPTVTNTQSFYIQDDIKITRNVQVNLGLRWDYQQSKGTVSDYLKFNKFKDNMQPRLGFIWDFTGEGRGKVFANFARFIETPIPLDVNVRAGGDEIQLDRNSNVSRLNAGPGTVLLQGTAAGLGCLGCHSTPAPVGLKPQDVLEYTAGFEYEIVKDLALGVRGIYRAQDSVVEDGSFDDGTNYFLFNPGETANEDVVALIPGLTDAERQTLIDRGDIFGRARRYYRALEFTATKRFTNNYQFIASYVYSSLIGNYEGLFRNDNGQSDPNITSLFDLPELLPNTYGRLPNDRPHQFKLDGSYRWPFKLMTSASFRTQSGRPFDALTPHAIYGNNEGFENPRGTSINPVTGSNRTPTTYNLDLGAYYPIHFGENRQLRFQFDWFNVTNAQRAVTQDQTLRINSGIPGAQGIQFANQYFGQGLVFQFPSSVRMGVKFQF